MKTIEIFKAGKQTASNGKTIDFSAADLEASAKAYNPQLHEAPIVVGHPKEDAPAYGWIKGLSFAESSLLASPDQVDASFAELVKQGKFKKVSASFYLPDSPQNPSPGVYYLRHVGFLGAMPPAVKGLKPVAFAGSDEGVIEFGDWEDGIVARLFRGLREFVISKWGTEEADKVLPSYSIEDLETSARTPEEMAMPAYSEQNRGQGAATTEGKSTMDLKELETREAALKAREAKFAEREAGVREKELSVQRAGHLAFVEGLVKTGKMLAAQRDHAVALLDFAAGIEGGTIEFGEKKATAVQSLKDFLACQPKIIEFGEVAGKDNDPGKDGDPEKEIANYMEKHQGATYREAALAVSEQKPELFKNR